jgi:hypothetical protein
MKDLCRAALLLACFFPLTKTAKGQARNAGYEYISPVPGSRFVSPTTDIILRPRGTFDAGETVSATALRVIGSLSGVHTVKCLISDDQRTLVCHLNKPFSAGEAVSVRVLAGTVTSSGIGLDTLSFTFTTRNHVEPLREPSSFANEQDESGASPLHLVPSVFENSPTPTDSTPSDFPVISVTNPGKIAVPGGVFMANFAPGGNVRAPYLIIASTDGIPLWYRKMTGQCLDFKRQPNALFTYYDTSVGCFLAMDTSYAVVDTFRCGNGYATDPHELQLLSNGHALLMSYDTEPYAMDTVVQGGSPNAHVTGLIIQELDKSKNVVFQWRSWDHVKITDSRLIDLTASLIDYIHGNALDTDPDGNILLSSRHFSEITKINRQTGDIIWRCGGTNNQFTLVNDSLWFAYQHAVRRLPNGHITLYDNGNEHNPKFSRAVEYVLDEQNKTATLVWEYRHSPILWGSATGFVQRLADGSTLVDWGFTNPNLTLVAPDNTAVFDMSFAQGVYTYRAFLYPLNQIAGLGGNMPILPSVCRLDQNYPNPFNPSTTISYELPKPLHVTLKVFSSIGQDVASLVDENDAAGIHTVQFNGSGLASGVYFYRLRAGDFVAAKKLILVK